jgi:hypothetical protein
MKRTLAVPAWVKDEQMLLSYLMSPHEGHPYPEDVLDAICLITSWVLIAVSVVTVAGVLVDAALR